MPAALSDTLAAEFPKALGAPRLRQALREAEARAAGSVEVARVFSVDGELLLEKAGDFASVTFTARELARLAGNVVTHSHPGVGSFSLDDVALAAAWQVRELRASDAIWAYSLAPAGWQWDYHWWQRQAAPALREIEVGVRRELAAALGAGAITSAEMESEYWHRVWAGAAGRLDLRYRRKPRGKKP